MLFLQEPAQAVMPRISLHTYQCRLKNQKLSNHSHLHLKRTPDYGGESFVDVCSEWFS